MTGRRKLFLHLPLYILYLLAVSHVAIAEGIEAITAPSQDVTLSFVRPGHVAEIPVKEGDSVEAGQMLMRQDDQAEVVQVEQLKAQADNTLRIKAAEAELEQKKVYLQRLQEAAGRGAATEMEVELAKLDVVIAELTLELAKFDHEQDIRKYEEMKIEVDRMQLKSPFAGKVEQILIDKGESADAQQKAIRIVKTDTLWIDVPVALAQAESLKLGQAAKVEFPAEEGKTVDGTIIHIAAVADAASNTVTVRVEVPNTAGRPAGEHVTVTFTTQEKTATPKDGGSNVPQNTAPQGAPQNQP
jgi:RND family efflux transporter MFP subunit